MLWFSKKKVEKDLEKILAGKQQTKRYLGILDSYGVSWPLEKAARDTLQNFFDGNNQTLDGIDINIEKYGWFDNYTIRIKGNAKYDHRMLLHLGGTTKEDSKFTAGGIGEGAKILALVLLRDYEFSQVRFRSKDWIVDFAMDNIPESDYIRRQKGLFAIVSKTQQPIEGNLVEFKTCKEKYAKEFEKAKDLFYHAGHKDFENPTLDIKKVGGFKFLGKRRSKKETPNGNFYFAGQRRHFDVERWGNVEFVSIWAYGNNLLRKDRDRGLITRYELLDTIVPAILSAAPEKDLERVVYEMEPIWPEDSGYDDLVGPKLLEEIARKLSYAGAKLKFDDKYLARSLSDLKDIEKLLEQKGYVLCNHALSKIGMKSASEKFKELQKHYRMDTNTRENKRIEILHETAFSFGKDTKEIWVYDMEAEKNIIEGQYNEKFIWLSRQALSKPYHEAVATYLHEIDHQYGDDYSRKFSGALTNTMETVIKHILENPEVYGMLERAWENA